MDMCPAAGSEASLCKQRNVAAAATRRPAFHRFRVASRSSGTCGSVAAAWNVGGGGGVPPSLSAGTRDDVACLRCVRTCDGVANAWCGGGTGDVAAPRCTHTCGSAAAPS